MTTLTDRQDNTALTVTQSPNLAVIDSESILNKITFGGFWQLKNLLFNQAPMKMPLLLEHACRERELELLLSSNTLKLNQSLERLKLTENERDAAENARIFAEKEALETIKHVQTLIKELQEAKTRVFALEQTMNELEKKMLVSAEISASRIAQLESELTEERVKRMSLVANTELAINKLLNVPCYVGGKEDDAKRRYLSKSVVLDSM